MIIEEMKVNEEAAKERLVAYKEAVEKSEIVQGEKIQKTKGENE